MPSLSSSSILQLLPAPAAFSARVFDVLLRRASQATVWFFLLVVVGTATAQTSPVTLYAALSANPVRQGTSPAAIAVIGCTSACGTMTYLMDGQTFGVIPVNADGTIAFPPISSTLAVGSHTLTVQYGGNATYAATSASYSFTVVSAAPTSLSLNLAENPVPVNEAPHMLGQLGCNSACGVVYFYLDGTLFQNSTADSTGLIGNLLGSNLPLGWHILTVSYPGNATYSASATSIAFHVIPDVLPPVSLAIALPSAPYVTGTSPNVITALGCRGSCSGYLAWYLDGQLFQNWAASSTGGTASPLLVNGIAAGSHTLSVTYSGDSQNAPTSASYPFNAVTATPTSLTLSLAENPVPADETPSMSGQIGCNTSCGTVYYYIDGTIFQNSTANSTGQVGNLLTPLPPLPYSEVAPGWHILTESYPGNSIYSASSVSIPFQIVPDTLPIPSLTATLPTNPVVFGTAPNVTTTLGCGSNCSGYFTWYMDGTLFQNWAVNSNGVDVPSVVNGSALTMGPHTITIRYGGNAQYAPTTTSLSFVVTPATHGTLPVVTWGVPAAVPYGTTLSSSQLSAVAPSSIPGTLTYSPVAGTTPATGKDVLTVTFTPNDATTYTSTSQSVVLAVNKAVPTITWPQPSPITFGNQLTTTQLNATTTVSGTMTYSPTLDSIPPTGVDQLTATFTPSDYTDYTVVSKTINLTVNKATPVITWLPAAITYGTALASAQLNADASVQGTFAYSPAAGTVPVAGSGTLTGTFTPTDTTDYNTATTSVSLLVNKASPALTWTTPSAITYGTALGATQLDASAGGLAGSFTYSPALGTVLGVGTQILSVTFTPTSANYASSTASVSLVVSPTITALSTSAPQEGASLAITGSGFGESQGTSAVMISGLAASIQRWANSSITAKIPTGAASGSGMVSVTVNGIESNAPSLKLPVTLTVSLNASTTSLGTPVMATATVTSGTPSTPQGTISCISGSIALPSQTIPSSGILLFTFNNLPVGSDTITCAFTHAAGTFWKDTTGLAIEVVTPALFPVVVSLSSAGASTTYGDLVTLSTAVTSQKSPITPTGSVSFYVDGNILMTQSLNGGVSQITTGALLVGSHAIYAAYSGDQNFSPGSSSTITQTTTNGSGACIR